jgi:hypothetical protein
MSLLVDLQSPCPKAANRHRNAKYITFPSVLGRVAGPTRGQIAQVAVGGRNRATGGVDWGFTAA